MDDNCDACNIANIKISGRDGLPIMGLTCYGTYGGSTHERLLSESSHSNYVGVSVCICIASYCAYLLSYCLEDKT
jgi:hypothetical protein